MAKGNRAGRAARGGGGSRTRFVFLGVLGFFVLAMGVIARRSLGISQTRKLRDLELRRDAIDAARVKLESEIREASSRARLGPIAEQRLHMYVPADSQVIILSRQREQKAP